MEKNVTKKIRIRLLPLFVFLLVILCILLVGKIMIDLPIHNIIVVGNHYLTDQEIIETAGIEEYPSFIRSYFSPLKENLEKNLWIKKASIKRKFFGVIEIQIEEKEPLFEKVENKVIVLSDGTEIPSTSLESPVLGLLNYVPNTKYDTFIKQMGKIDPSIRYLISEITYLPNEQDKDRFLLYMSDGNYVYLTLTKFQNINYYEQVLEQLAGRKGILYLDSGNHFQIMEDISNSN